MTDRGKTLFSSSYEYFSGRTLTRLDGLTDDEYLWEPVDGCWSVHVVDGQAIVDWEFAPPDPAPVTTIAWRLVHVGSCLREHGLRSVAFDGGAARHVAPTRVPTTADDALAMLRDAMSVWRNDLARLSEDRLWEPLGSEAGPYADEPMAAFIEHIHDELIHHSAEVGLLRDLYAHRPA